MKTRIQAHAAHGSAVFRLRHAAALLAALSLVLSTPSPVHPYSGPVAAPHPDDSYRPVSPAALFIASHTGHSADPVTVLAEREAAGSANDPGLAKQAFLRQIGADIAWKRTAEQTAITIAIVDTGVDLDHPDLQPNLLPGINLLQRDQPPRDDNGHGTSVAGVLAAAGNNGQGVAGVLWKARILPVKALDAQGYGEERRLGEGIKAAIDEGARIVLLSVGLYHSSSYMREITAYAEKKGVLLVAASGNDGRRFGNRALVKYPAAYPTVLAVGGAGVDGISDSRTNKGTELDLTAPWKVYTTEAGGGYHYVEGTSMSAPQVAAAAALLWAKYPDLKPFQIRSMLRQTAKDEGVKGFDSASGYGLLRLDAALSARYQEDPHEPNNESKSAAALPLGKQLSAQLTGEADKDWYRLDSPYDGVVTLGYTQLTTASAAASKVKLELREAGKIIKKDLDLRNHKLQWNVKKGPNLLMLRPAPGAGTKKISYLLETTLRMLPDKGESNDSAQTAYPLPDKSLVFKGTFHKSGDVDWYRVKIAQKGTLRLQVEAGTMRMDPAFLYRRAGETARTVDGNGEGVTESSPLLQVTPGIYEFKVWDVGGDADFTAAGYYTLRMTKGK